MSLILKTYCVCAQLSPLGGPTDSGMPGFSVYGLFQARILKWLPLLTTGDLPDSGIEPAFLTSPTQAAGSLPLVPLGNLKVFCLAGLPHGALDVFGK